jgi:shikimate kinase
MSARPRPPIFLVGFMGAGKSACAVELGRLLGRAVADTDALVERRAGRTVARIFAEDGEGGFRRWEREAVRGELGGDRVVAVGGGAFADASLRAAMIRAGLTVWLDLPLEEARRRVGDGRDRPLWPEDPLELRALFERRRAVYALCSIRVAAWPGDAAETARRVSRAIP